MRPHRNRLDNGESVMRQLLLMALLLVGAGCYGLGERIHCRRGMHGCSPTEPCDKKAAKPAEIKAAPTEEISGPARSTQAQEVLLVPRMVYVPFVAQTPTAPVRMTSNMTVVPPGGPKDQVTDRPCPAEDKALVKKMLEVCERLNDRIDRMEKCLREREASPPPVICPAPARTAPLFGRPLFNRGMGLFQRCEPQCETLQPCEPVLNPPASVELLPMPAKKGPIVTIE